MIIFVHLHRAYAEYRRGSHTEYVEDTELARGEVDEHRPFFVYRWCACPGRYHTLATVQTKLLTFHWISRSEKETGARACCDHVERGETGRRTSRGGAFFFFTRTVKSYERKKAEIGDTVDVISLTRGTTILHALLHRDVIAREYTRGLPRLIVENRWIRLRLRGDT
ncbi:hypothetical protein ANTQUA_LOCUS4613 [Anthophora quadrimaculata]